MGLISIFDSNREIDIVSVARNEKELVAQYAALQADVVMLDFTSKGFSAATVNRIVSKNANAAIVAITPPQRGKVIVDAVRAGISSYVKKDCSKEEIAQSVVETARGHKFFCNQVLETVRRESIDLESVELADVSCDAVFISERELEIIALIAEGYTNTQIAETLFISSHTVGTHRKNIMAKLGVNNTAGIVMYAVQQGLASPNTFLFTS
ncbi:MAG: response regulator transcription factor [Flavobacteriales bacterium]|nr:response regulator transcription factor [Flavobacteriales bacterium]